MRSAKRGCGEFDVIRRKLVNAFLADDFDGWQAACAEALPSDK